MAVDESEPQMSETHIKDELITASPPSSSPPPNTEITPVPTSATPDPIAPVIPTVETSPPPTMPLAQPTAPSSDPQISLTFLLASGRRRTLSFPEQTTTARVKEILWNTWPLDWIDEQPPAPGFLRILHLGKLWTDEQVLADLRLPRPPSQPNVVHVSIRPFLPSDNDVPVKKTRKGRRAANISTTDNDEPYNAPANDTANTRGGCCGCIIC